MARYKYVIMKAHDMEWPLLFPEKMIHLHMAAAMTALLRTVHKADPEDIAVKSAGFVNIDIDQVEDRASESLGIGPHEDDQIVFETYNVASGDYMKTILEGLKVSHPEEYAKHFGKKG